MDLISLIILIIGCTWQAMPLGGDEGRDGEEEGKQSKCGGGARWKILLFPLIGRTVRLLLVVLKPWNSMLVPSFRERLKFNKLLAHWSAPHVLLFDRCQSAAGSVRFYVSVRMWASIYQGFFFPHFGSHQWLMQRVMWEYLKTEMLWLMSVEPLCTCLWHHWWSWQLDEVVLSDTDTCMHALGWGCVGV